MYSYTVITHVHFIHLDILIRSDVDFATLQRFFNYSILARLENFVDLSPIRMAKKYTRVYLHACK